MRGYDRFRTGLTFREVRRMLWSYSDDKATWRNVTRATVLGHWHELKLQLWGQTQDARRSPERRREMRRLANEKW